MKDYLKKSIQMDKQRLLHYQKIASISITGRLNCRWDKYRSKYKYYLKESGDEKEHYIPEKPDNRIWKIQRKRFAQCMIKVLENNIKAKEILFKKLLPDSEVDIVEKMPHAYRPNSNFKPKNTEEKSNSVHQSENPYKRENLTVKTSFGLFVRSKGEMIIAELLYSLGIEFYYEKALIIRVQRTVKERIQGELVEKVVWEKRTVYPDFTIILPNGQIYYWEHEGMLTDPEYAKNTIQKMIDYNMNNIYQAHNLIVTAEGPHNDIDVEGIKRIITGLLL